MATTSATNHANEIRRLWGRNISGRPVTVVRRIKGRTTWSQHAYGNAVDFTGKRTTLNTMATWAARNASKWAVANIIRNGRIWSHRTRAWRKYGGTNPHTTHVHIDYLPQWTGTPPGRPVGTTGSAGRQYPLPLTLSSPYAGAWRPVIATALFTDRGLTIEPRTATVTQIAQAVVAYNRRHGLSATSFVRADTWQKLGRHTVRRPARGSVVQGGQMFLRNYGYLSSRQVDGRFGSVTRQAVTRFQSTAQIRVTGLLGPNEWAALWWGPAAWAIPADRFGRGEGWTRTPEGQPAGEIEHSWEGTLRGLAPLVDRAAHTAIWSSRAIRSHISR